jgi:hypothetical protein
MFSEPLGEVLSWKSSVSPERAREVYFRVTGKPFNSVPPPRGAIAERVRSGWESQWDWQPDENQGGDVVAGRVKDLALVESRIDGLVDADGAWTYGEWTMVFKNDSPVQREARAQILLPAGGVVSRLTLWINGEPCEAAFAGRDQVKAAYKDVVTVQRRDPVLVTTAGPDRVMMQCFPVPAGGGTMKIRMGITAPMRLCRMDQAVCGLPSIIERNFGIRESMGHSVWIESSAALSDASGLLKAEHPKKELYALRGELKDSQLSALGSTVTAARNVSIRTTWAGAPAHIKNVSGVFVQSIEPAPQTPPGSVVVVIDGSRTMSSAIAEVAQAISSLPAGVRLSVIVAGDEVVELTSGPVAVTGESVKAAAEKVRGIECRGGADSVPALCRAWDLASESPDGVILWVHGPQPVLLEGIENLTQRYERRPDGPKIWMAQAAAGPNRVCESLNGLGDFSTVARGGKLGDDLQRLFYSWSSGRSELVVTRAPAPVPPVGDGVKQTSPHLARLWALDEVRRLTSSGRKLSGSKGQEAMKLAADYQLVTPISGAVVLETAAQYARHGLKPVDAATVPTVPEPETVMLLIVAGAVGVWVLWRRRRAA